MMGSGLNKVAPVVSILNMKGGVGKTTISAHVFREFYRYESKNVLLIDFDPQFNLTQTVLLERPYEVLKRQGKTVLSVLEKPKSLSLYDTHDDDDDGEVPKTSELSHLLKKTSQPEFRLELIPGNFSLAKFSLTSDLTYLNRAKARFEAFIAEARQSYDVVCIDCNPSSSFLTRCVLGVSTHLLIPVRPDRYSMLGIRLLDDFIDGHHEIKEKPRKIIVLNGVPGGASYDPAVENELRADPAYGPMTLTTHLPLTGILEAKPSYTGFATDRRVKNSKKIQRVIIDLSREIAVSLGFK